MTAAIAELLLLMKAHPLATYSIVFALCFLESLVLVGLIIPGTVLLLGLGSLLAAQVVSIPLVILFAILGAILGDSVSFFIGQRFQNKLEYIWPFRRYPNLLSRGKLFFYRHGGKSVFLGRFFQPVRPVVPLIAGMLGMSETRFLVFNCLSAILWVIGLIGPGLLIADAINTTTLGAHLSLLSLVLTLFFWGLFWLFYKLIVIINKFSIIAVQRMMKLLIITFSSIWALFVINQAFLNIDYINRLDGAIYWLFLVNNNAFFDSFFTIITELGDWFVNLIIILSVLFVFIYMRSWRTAFYWAVACFGSFFLTQFFKIILARPRPTALYEGVHQYAFPSGHAVITTTVYGFLAILLMSQCKSKSRIIILILALIFSLCVCFSRVYLSVHWLSDVVGGFFLAWSLITLAAYFYLRKPQTWNQTTVFFSTIISFAVFGGIYANIHYREEKNIYKKQIPVIQISKNEWLFQHKTLDYFRINSLGFQKEPFTVQYAGNIKEIKNLLLAHDFKEAEPLTLNSIAPLFDATSSLTLMPVLPELFNGQFERLILYRQKENSRLVFRIWWTNYVLENGEPLSFGTIEEETIFYVKNLFALPAGNNHFNEGLWLLKNIIGRKLLIHEKKRSDGYSAVFIENHPGIK